MPQFLGAIAALAVYAWLCILALTYVVGPSLPWVVLAGSAVGVVLVVVVLVGTLLRVERFAAVTITPFDARTRLPKPRSLFPRDEAWPHYLFGQARTDLGTAIGHTAELVSRMWLAMGRAVKQEPTWLAVWPLLILPAVGAVSLTVAGVAAVVVVHGVVAAVLILTWLGWLVGVGVLRGADAAIARLRRAKATCHHAGCNHRSTLPAYRCGRCGNVHHDIRAGRQGLFVRRCSCGQQLPTTVLGAAGLVAICQRCGLELRAGAALLTDVVIPVFGPASAGKTRLVAAGMVALDRHLAAVGGTLRAVGPESESALRVATAVVDERRPTDKTAGTPPAGITVRLGFGKRKALLHLFDAAGEFFSDREQNRELPFLDDAQGLVFVLDPFSIVAVGSALRGAFADRVTAALPALEEPETSYNVTAQGLRDQGVRLDRKPLVVAVVKADLLLGLPPAAGLDPAATSAEVQAWLRDQGLDNLVETAARDFSEVRYQLVSSYSADPGPLSPARPLLWLLARSGVPVPDPDPAVTP